MVKFKKINIIIIASLLNNIAFCPDEEEFKTSYTNISPEKPSYTKEDELKTAYRRLDLKPNKIYSFEEINKAHQTKTNLINHINNIENRRGQSLKLITTSPDYDISNIDKAKALVTVHQKELKRQNETQIK